ncbi:VOC family protein [Nocardioides panacisoli]|uniref:VOC family protein n=1 Tax=Nocardioides panacisoli TaxID=627624 RepID=A0ABP7IIM9_9ACTN
MPLATYKDLCIDAVDARRMGEFWAKVLDLDLEELDDGDTRLTGSTPQHTVWINTVPEPVSVKQRVHLDVAARTVDDVLGLGASPVDLESFRWKVLRDPEGGELCVFERDSEALEPRLFEIVVDSVDPAAQAAWWADVLDATVGREENDRYSWVEGIVGAPFDYLVFVPVPEAKTVKNRIHIDVEAGDIPDIVGRGATRLREPDDEVRWTVLADPEGNEFCAFEPRRINDDVDPLPPEADFPG